MNKLFLLSIASSLLFIVSSSGKTKSNRQEDYVCTPCGSDCDGEVHKGPGTCSHCHMALVKKSTITQKNIEPGDLCAFIAKQGSEDVLLLDVRTVAEFEGKDDAKFGRLANAVNIPIQDLDKRMGELNKWKGRPIVVYCSHSHRSPRASYMLSQNGFQNVTNMLGGMSTWKTSVKDNDCNQKLFISQ
jgi:rhodanese-related sulfurtransferase